MSADDQERIVLTGPPGSGKTAALNLLSAAGRHTVPEAARLVVDQLVSDGADQSDFRGTAEFQRMVESVDVESERRATVHNRVYFDRALADNIAFREAVGLDVPAYLRRRVDHDYGTDFPGLGGYDYAYVFDPVGDGAGGGYARDSAPDYDADELTSRLFDVYAMAGANVEAVTEDTVLERARRVEPSLSLRPGWDAVPSGGQG